MSVVPFALPSACFPRHDEILFEINSFLSVETGWAITAHAVGLGRPMDEHLETTGKAVPGYDGTTLFTCHVTYQGFVYVLVIMKTLST